MEAHCLLLRPEWYRRLTIKLGRETGSARSGDLETGPAHSYVELFAVPFSFSQKLWGLVGNRAKSQGTCKECNSLGRVVPSRPAAPSAMDAVPGLGRQ